MKTYCENPNCEKQAVKEVPVSVDRPGDQLRALCATCEESYSWGVQHGKITAQHEKRWILAVADKGIVAQAQAYRSQPEAERGIIAYLRDYERYEGSDDFGQACQWLAVHDERLSVEIFEIDALPDAEDKPPGTSDLSCFMQQGGFVVLAINRQDAHADYLFEAWAYKGPLDFTTAEPVTFGRGTDVPDALEVLNGQLAVSKHDGKNGPAKKNTAKRRHNMSQKSITLVVKERELATMLAALRFHQDENLQGSPGIPDQAIEEIASNSGALKPLDFNEVSKLCEKINTCPETCTQRQKEVWVLAVTDRGMVVHARAYPSRFQAEKAMLDYLRSYQGYDGQDNIAKACDWLAKQEGNLRVDICSTQVDCSDTSPPLGLTIAPPPEEKGEEPLFRVVYVIDVNAREAHTAAKYTHQIMMDPNSMPPVLQVINNRGETVTVDLSESQNHIQKENHYG